MDRPARKITVLGLGYIGLPTASLLGTKGYKVHGVDTRAEVVDTINQGRIHIVEPDLDILVKSAVQSGNLTASLEPADADVFIIAVPTPLTADRTPDLSHVEAAARTIAPFVKPGNLVLLESTSPVGTTEHLVGRILREAGHPIGDDVFLAHCPERVLPGKILTELVHNDRIVGGVNEASTDVAAEFLSEFVSGEVFKTTAATAELAKLVENAYRDVNIAFANEISMVAERAAIDPWDLIRLANRHPRVNILQPGPGVGGHCIAVDPWFIIHGYPDDARLIRTAREVNDRKPGWIIEKVKQRAGKFRNPVIACLGLAFKADVDDLRESPALQIVRALRDSGVGEIVVCEPNVRQSPEFPLIPMQEAIDRADIVLVLVDHKQFRALKAADLKEKVLMDTRGAIQ
jgi:UDP-N-acetyl-D-mannosaminuronic acid dehydrogenase